MNIWGLGSNMDTGLMIEQLMKLESIPYTKLQEKKENFTSFQSFFRTLNTKLSTLKDKASELTLNSNFNLTTTTSSDEQTVKATGSDKAISGNYQVVVEQLAHSHVIQSNGFKSSDLESGLVGQKITIQEGKETLEFELKGKNNGEVLENLKNEINRKSKSVQATVVETSPGEKTVVFTSAKTGEANSFTKDSGQGVVLGGALASLGLFDSAKNSFNTVQAARDAKLTVNGLEIKSASNEIKGVIEGVTLNLKKENSTAMISVGQDSDKVVEKVKEFVNSFNEVRKLIRDNVGKGKPLQGDSTLRQLDSELYNWLSGNIAGLGTMADVGIEIDKGKKTADEMTGQITFDEKKFKEQLNQEPDKVISMFNVEGKSGKGIATIFSEELKQWTNKTNGLIQSRIKGYDSDITYVTDSMEKMELRLQNKEQQLKRQFSAMEVALGKLKNEQNWLQGQFNSLTRKD